MQDARLGQWLRFLSVPGAEARMTHPASAAARAGLHAGVRARMQTHLEALAAQPVVVEDDGVVRRVTALEAARYGYNRAERSFFAAIRNADGRWHEAPGHGRDLVIFDTYLPLRTWRRRLHYRLRSHALDQLLATVPLEGMDARHRRVLGSVCHALIDAAWRALGLRATLRTRFPTKRIRREVRETLRIDPGLLALARAARLRARQHGISQRWLTFVWQQHDTLARIRLQTPALLPVVAMHLYQHGSTPGVDPTRACADWLQGRGMRKAGYRLLARHGARRFVEVTRRFHADDALDALVLALTLAEGGHEARLPTPLFYQVTLDQFEQPMGAGEIRHRLLLTPPRLFQEAAQRLAAAASPARQQRVALEYRAILDYFMDIRPDVGDAGWARWLALAEEDAARRRAALKPASWPCAVEQLRTPDAEVLALATALSLFEEGRALRHCAYSYVEQCRRDHVRLFSARMHHHGRSERATIGLMRRGRQWRIWDIRGACNRRMGGHWIALARQLAETYSRRDGSAQLPLPIHHEFDRTG